jgi:hypothetical protein
MLHVSIYSHALTNKEMCQQGNKRQSMFDISAVLHVHSLLRNARIKLKCAMQEMSQAISPIKF